MIATVTNQGKMRWLIIDEAFNADRLIEFLASPDQGGQAQGIPDSGQSARAPQQAGQSMAG